MHFRRQLWAARRRPHQALTRAQPPTSTLAQWVTKKSGLTCRWALQALRQAWSPIYAVPDVTTLRGYQRIVRFLALHVVVVSHDRRRCLSLRTSLLMYLHAAQILKRTQEMPTTFRIFAGHHHSSFTALLDNARPSIFFNNALYILVRGCGYDCQSCAVLSSSLEFHRHAIILIMFRNKDIVFSRTVTEKLATQVGAILNKPASWRFRASTAGTYRLISFLVCAAPSISSKYVRDMHWFFVAVGVTPSQSLNLKLAGVTLVQAPNVTQLDVKMLSAAISPL